MKERDDSDFLTALAIGAVVGIGAALLFRASDDLDKDEIIKRLKPLRKKARRALRTASRSASHRMSDAADAGRALRKGGGRIAHELEDHASEIVKAARKEIRASARDSVKQARRAMRQAAKRMA